MKILGSNYLYNHIAYNAFASSEYLEQYLKGKAKAKPVFIKQLTDDLESCVTISREVKQHNLDDLSRDILNFLPLS